jgi:hypothetical protein
MTPTEQQERDPLQPNGTAELFAARPWNCNREWRGEHKPIPHTARCCQVYWEAEKIKSGYFIATPHINTVVTITSVVAIIFLFRTDKV